MTEIVWVFLRSNISCSRSFFHGLLNSGLDFALQCGIICDAFVINKASTGRTSRTNAYLMCSSTTTHTLIGVKLLWTFVSRKRHEYEFFMKYGHMVKFG